MSFAGSWRTVKDKERLPVQSFGIFSRLGTGDDENGLDLRLQCLSECTYTYIPAQRNVLWVVIFFGFVIVKCSGSGTDIYSLARVNPLYMEWSVTLCNRPAALDATSHGTPSVKCSHVLYYILLSKEKLRICLRTVTKRIGLVR